MHNFSLLMQSTQWDWVSAFDSNAYKLVTSFMSEGLTSFMKLISFIGSGWILTPLAVLILLVSFLNRKTARWGGLIALNYAAVSLLNYILKNIIKRQRPDILQLADIEGYSFPSWHAMTAMSFFGLLIYLTVKHLKHPAKYVVAGIMGILILLIGISRVYLGVHYMSDVLGGYIIGLVWVCSLILLSRKVIK